MIKKERFETNDVKDVLEKSFSDFDAHRVDGLTNLSVFQESKTAADERNLIRLQRKYGEDHLLARETQAKIEASRFFAAEIKNEIRRTQTPVPAANADAWTIHGYVFNEENKAVPNAPVTIFDERREPIARDEKTAADKKGYFRLPIKNIENLPETVRVGVTKEFVGEEVFKPESGEVDYIEIFVSGEIGETPPCEPIPTGQGFSDWLLTGKVADSRGKGVANLKVRVFNRALTSEDALGEAETNADGIYRIVFTKKQFGDFIEKHPELYLIVEDAAGNKLFDGKRETRTRAGHIELIDVRLKENTNEPNKPKISTKPNKPNRK